MRAIQVLEDLTVRGNDVDTPRPGQGQALVRVHAAGVCGTDLHIVDGMIKPDAYPMTLGHDVQIGAADAGRVHPDQGLSLAGMRRVDVVAAHGEVLQDLDRSHRSLPFLANMVSASRRQDELRRVSS